MRRILCAGIAAGILMAIGCVNIPSKFEAHITVDIRQHIEQQAESTLDFIEGKKDTLPTPEKKTVPGKTSRLRAVFDFIDPMPTAWAAELKNTSPEVTRIATSLKSRFDKVQAIKDKGYAGESNRGYIELRNPDKIKSADERNEVQRVVAAENTDRKALYQEVAKLNSDKKVSVSTVESIYAVERLRRAQPGQIFQMPTGTEFDQFKKTDVAQRLGAEAAPGAWVVIK